MPTICFYFSGLALVLTYFLYPIILVLLRPKKPNGLVYQFGGSRRWPSISILISAYNEERLIGGRIANVLASSYLGKKELIIVSDGSDDRTAEVVRNWQCDEIRFISLEDRQGKANALNVAVQHARGEILVMTDADCEFVQDPDTLTEMVRPFFSAEVGLVTGSIKYLGSKRGNAYQRYEDFLRILESRWGTIAGALGTNYAIRKSLWKTASDGIMTDLYHPILVSLAGFRAIANPKAVAVTAMGDEFDRQVRIVSRAAFVYFRMIPSLILFGRWKSVFVLTCHKLLRWLTLPFFAILLLSSMNLYKQGTLFKMVFTGQIAFLLLASLGKIFKMCGSADWMDVGYQFLYLNWAAVIGLILCIRGKSPAVWEPRGR